MNRISSLAIAATIALLGATSVSTAQAVELAWGSALKMYWSGANGCKVWVQQVSQPAHGQPIRMVVKNVTKKQLTYNFNVRVVVNEGPKFGSDARVGSGSEVYRGRFTVDNAPPDQVSVGNTVVEYAGPHQGVSIMLSMTSCSVRG